jgi:hypothetical protein
MPVIGVSPDRITYDRMRTSHIQRLIRAEENISMAPNMASSSNENKLSCGERERVRLQVEGF